MTEITNELPVSAFVGDVVTRISPQASLLDVVDALAAAEIGVLVVGEGDAVDAIVSERDVVRALAARRDPATTTAIEIGHRELIWCDSTATVHEVALMMMEHYVRHILLEDAGTLVGVVSARDLLGVYAAGDPDVGDADW